MRFLAAIFAVLILRVVGTARAEGQYSVVGPGTLHSGRKYNVAVAAYYTTEPCQLKVGITGPSYNETKLVDLTPNELKNVEFDLPELEKGIYNLTAEGVTGIIFKNTTYLNYDPANAHIKVQTDKGTYKPGDILNFRVLFLDENLRPGKPSKEALVYIEDGKRNRIKEFKNIQVVKGVYTEKFKISEFPVLGSWRLVVKNGDRYDSYTHFQVDKYVLPKYSVKVEATENVAVQDGDMQVVVRSNYTYGKPVNAKVTLILSMQTYFDYSGDGKNERKIAPTLIKTADMVNGKAKFDLNVKEYEEYLFYKTSPSYLTVTATVEEAFTGVKINGTAGTLLYPFRYQMRCVSYETCSLFYAGKEAEVMLQVQHVDGTVVTDTKSVVKIVYKEAISKQYRWRPYTETTTPEPTAPHIENKTVCFESHLNATGFAIFKVTLPDLEEFEDYLHFFEMEAQYADEKRDVISAYQFRKPKATNPSAEEYKEPTEWFRADVIYKEKQYSSKLGDAITITVNSSEPLTYLIYNIIGRGNIQSSERLVIPDSPKIYNITLTPNFYMTPYGKIYLFYVDPHGELHYAETTFRVEVELQNKIEITAPEQVKPGEEVSLRIKTEPNSFVGLLAVDQSVLLLSGNNDIHANEFQWRLGSYDTYTPYQGGYSRYPGEYTGVVTLTNAKYFYNWTAPVYEHSEKRIMYDSESGVRVFPQEASKLGAAGPMGAGAASTAGIGSGGFSASDVQIRKDFSETWIFADIENSESAEFTWVKKIPDTITSWVLSGFAMHADKGLAVTNGTSKITTFQPFFISVRLPYSVKRGEVINVPALVFNYLSKDLDVEIILDNTDGEYDFTEVSNEVINESRRIKSIRVPANSAVGVSFMLRPKIIGNIMLKFIAYAPLAGDSVHKTLKVVPEGVTQYANRAYFVNLKDTPEFKESFELALPTEVVPDSQHIEFTVIGDILGPVLNNLDNLVRMPAGCGEQVTSTMVPNYLILQYLKTINKLTPALESRIKRNLESGYQRILSYQLNDGSFASFMPYREERDKPYNGSTWLTAYVVRSLYQAKNYIDVDENVIKKGLEYLAGRQAANGSFTDSNDFFYAAHREPLTLTAGIVLTFVETETLSGPYAQNLDKAFKYILENLEKSKNIHIKALVTYALHKAKLPAATGLLNSLKSMAQTDDDRQWWSQREEKPLHWWRWSYSSDVEITSYILLTLLDTESVDSALPIIKWLVAQRNSYGGFSSTQDTVVGLKALIKFAEKSGYEAAIMDIDCTAKGAADKQDSIKVTSENGLLLQSVELPQKTLGVDFHAKGKGAALVQIAYQYNVVDKEKKPSFTVTTHINKNTPSQKLELDVCVEFTGEGENSNMALVEISLPSGYVADDESFKHIKAISGVRQVETKHSESVIVVYFESLHKSELKCLPIEALKAFAVAMQKPAPVVVYDYYETEKKATSYYEVVSKLCDICEDDEECKKKCT